MAGAVLEARGVVKRFPGVVALDGVDFALQAGEVHCLVGENGAGKSSLIKLLCGLYAPDSGEVLLGGEALPRGTAATRDAGVATVHQEHNLVPALSVLENVMLGGWETRAGFVSRSRMRDHASSALSRVAPQIRLERRAESLSPAEGQLVEIARGIAQQARALILDEPTTALTERDSARLFELIRELRDEGMAILYVSHRLEEIFELGDRITVFRDGRRVATGPVAEYDQPALVRLMVGEDVQLYAPSEHVPGDVVLTATGLTRKGLVEDVSFELRAGEICGLGGLAGSGRSELAEMLFGVERPDAGEIRLHGEVVRFRHPVEAIKAGIGLVPEERKRQGIVEVLSVSANISLGSLDRIAHGGFLSSRAEREIAQQAIDDLQIRTPDASTPIASLSGGNQQKAVIARWLARRPDLLILDEPTKGVDIGAKAEIHRLVGELAQSGVAVLMISSDLEELLALSDRVLVMREGRLVASLDRDHATREEVMVHAALA